MRLAEGGQTSLAFPTGRPDSARVPHCRGSAGSGLAGRAEADSQARFSGKGHRRAVGPILGRFVGGLLHL